MPLTIDPNPMSYQPVGPLPVTPPSYELEKVKPPRVEPFTKDTLAPAQDREEIKFVPPEMAFFLLPIEQQVSGRPRLEQPRVDGAILNAGMAELTRLVSQAEKSDTENRTKGAPPKEDLNLSEIALLRAVFKALGMRRTNAETESILTAEQAKLRQQENEKLLKEYFEKYDGVVLKNKISTLFSWINWFTGGLSSLGILASIGLGLASGGVIPAIAGGLGLAGGILGVVSGTGTIFKGFVDADKNKKMGAMEQLKTKRELNTKKIQQSFKEMEESAEVVRKSWEDAREILKEWLQASMNK